MKLATLRDGTRDGRLLVVRADGEAAAPSPSHWPSLQARARRLGRVPSRSCARSPTGSTAARSHGVPLDPARLGAPLPRAYEWVDGSAFLNHVILVRKARNAEPPATLETDPLVYQGGSGVLLGAARSPSRSSIRRGASTSSRRSA